MAHALILVIDDNAPLREALREMLERAGYEVMEAANGKEGTERFRERQPDLVITDIIMPDKGGTEVIFDLQKNFPDVKIIAITGGGEGSAEDYLKSITSITNVKKTLCKPFAMSEMLEAVEDLLKE